MQRFILTSILLGVTGLAQAAPEAFQANYDITVKGVTLGSMQASLSYQGNNYTFNKLTKANGLAALFSGDTLTENVSGTKQGDKLSPSTYHAQHKNRRKNKSEDFNFTNPTTIQGSYDGNAYNLTVPAGTLDNATLELALMDSAGSSGSSSFNVVSKGKLHHYTFRHLGKETIDVPAGTYTCEKIQRTDDGSNETTLWIAPELNNAIVRAKHVDDGDVFESLLTNYQAH